VRRSGEGCQAKCPAHDDRRASLSISHGERQRLLLYCHAGCTPQAIVAALGLTMADLCAPRAARRTTASRLAATYDYKDERGTLLYQVCRFRPKNFRQRRPTGRDGWTWRLGDVRRVLYRLPELQQQPVVYVVEGEKDADRLHDLGLPATTNAGGAGKWRDEYTTQLRTASINAVVILPDQDAPGDQHADTIARSCHAAGLQVQVVLLPGLPPKGDVSDWLDAGHTRNELLALVSGAPVYEPRRDARTRESGSAARPRNSSQATRLVDLARAEGAELWHTHAGDPYITIAVDGHREHYALARRWVRYWLARLHYGATRTAPSTQAVVAAITTLSGIARFEGHEHPVSVRVAGHDDGNIYLDLGGPDWSAVAITPEGWRLIEEPPVRFERGGGMLGLPRPERGGTIPDVAAMLGLEADQATLAIGWLVGALRPRGPYPVLSLSGEHGSGKSTRARMIRGLVDPHEADLRAEPREVRDLMIAASSGWIIAIDNISRVQDWLSDALSRIATGGALGTRTLHTDRDETILAAIRPIILTGISEVATRGDLLDRCLSLTLAPLRDARRRTEAMLWADYERQRPCLLGALLEAVSGALRTQHQIELPILPRMADWCEWVTAAEPACGWAPRTLLDAYLGSREAAIETLLDGEVLAAAVRRLVLPWTGTATELLERIAPAARPPQGWPGSPRALSAALRRLAPALRGVGIDVQTDGREPGTGRRLIVIRENAGGEPSPPSQPSQRAHLPSESRDRECDDPTDRHSSPSQAEPHQMGLSDRL
jgi:hypothetical protein